MTKVITAVTAVAVLALAAIAQAQQRLVVLDDVPQGLHHFTVTPDGSKVIFGGGKFIVFDKDGKVIDQISMPLRSSPINLIPLSDGKYIGVGTYGGGRVSLCRADGSEERVIIPKGRSKEQIHSDNTSWNSPQGAAVDEASKLIFVLDSTVAPIDDRKIADPDWSRIGVWSFDGKYVRSINAYGWDDPESKTNVGGRTRYRDIEVDPASKTVYVTNMANNKLMAWSYEGKLLNEVDSPGGGIAVFPDGRVAVCGGDKIIVFGKDLKQVKEIKSPAGGMLNLEADAAGKLYASCSTPTVTFIRWAADLETHEIVGPRFISIYVQFNQTWAPAGKVLKVRATVSGRPEVTDSKWQAICRRADGSNLRWTTLESSNDNGTLSIQVPADMRGIYDVAVRFGDGPLNHADRDRDLFVMQTIAIAPENATASICAITANARRAFVQGEAIPLQLIERRPAVTTAPNAAAEVTLELLSGGKAISTAELQLLGSKALEIPASVTRNLAPGQYVVRPRAEGFASYELPIAIASSQVDSPVQRIIYHEFASLVPHLQNATESMNHVREQVIQTAELGFTRATDRAGVVAPGGWNREICPADLREPALAVGDYYAMPQGGWTYPFYLDQAAARGLAYDTQILPHCAAVRSRDIRIAEMIPVIQGIAQTWGNYPSFYGINYNDEMFYFTNYDKHWNEADTAFIDKLHQEQFAGRPKPDALLHAMRQMYDAWNAAAREAGPNLKLTTTPMWQFPAVEGSYPPNIYQGMDESYSHFLSEGFQMPWYATHSVDFLRRPGLPLMGVFDNGYLSEDGEIYLKYAMQVLGRGVQGVGVEHTHMFSTGRGTDAYRVANLIAKMYGPVFAQAQPLNEAAVLYSYAQDITERRSVFGTPHWERVWAMEGAGLMIGLPTAIVMEEDLSADWLLADGRPRVRHLFLVGQTAALPAAVEQAIAKYEAAGGKVWIDADSAPRKGASQLDLHTYVLKGVLGESYAADSAHPIIGSVLEEFARSLAKEIGQDRGYPLDTDDLWVAKNVFDGGEIRYIMLANETSPFPWDAGIVWSLGQNYCKNRDTHLPKVVTLTMPAPSGVVYDMFDQSPANVKASGNTATLSVDLRHFPGRLYAISKAPMGAPRVMAGANGQQAQYDVQVVDKGGKELSAVVPLRLRLFGDAGLAWEVFRGSDAKGKLIGRFDLPANAKTWTLEVTELVSGRGSAIKLAGSGSLEQLIVERPDAEVLREEGVRRLLAAAKTTGKITIADEKVLSDEQVKALTDALKQQSIEAKVAALPVEPTAGVTIAAGIVEGKKWGPMVAGTVTRNLLPHAISSSVPGAKRGVVGPAFAPRSGVGEHAIVLIGGDADGLANAVKTFVALLGKPENKHLTTVAVQAKMATGRPAVVAPVPVLRDMVGARLGEVAVSSDGKHLALASYGYQKNLALLQDNGNAARIVRTMRVGQTASVDSLWLSDDGKQFGAGARFVDRFGSGFGLVNASSGLQKVFTSFGSQSSNRFHHAVSSDGQTVIVGGVYGVVCWKRAGEGWQEAWAIDYWQQFDKLDWPVAADAERIPNFQAYIPRGQDYALIVFNEFTNNGWNTPSHFNSAYLAAVSLKDGSEKWRFDVPVPKSQLFATLHTSPNGREMLLQVQVGSWGSQAFRFFKIDNDGKLLLSWNSVGAPQTAALDDAKGTVVESFKDRLLEIRDAKGVLLQSIIWNCQPLSAAFSGDGSKLYIADDSGRITAMDLAGKTLWQVRPPCMSTLAANGENLYAAGWDGVLRSYTSGGKPRWQLSCTKAFTEDNPIKALAESVNIDPTAIVAPRRANNVQEQAGEGENLLAGCVAAKREVKDADGKVIRVFGGVGNARAFVHIGGTSGWMSEGKVSLTVAELVNGKTDDVEQPWLSIDETYWTATGGRQVWVEIDFEKPTDVKSLTVYENPKFKENWPTDGLVQVWNEKDQKWITAKYGLFLNSSVNTYKLDLKGVTKLRYLPWNSYFRNFRTSEIEVR